MSEKRFFIVKKIINFMKHTIAEKKKTALIVYISKIHIGGPKKYPVTAYKTLLKTSKDSEFKKINIGLNEKFLEYLFTV